MQLSFPTLQFLHSFQKNSIDDLHDLNPFYNQLLMVFWSYGNRLPILGLQLQVIFKVHVLSCTIVSDVHYAYNVQSLEIVEQVIDLHFHVVNATLPSPAALLVLGAPQFHNAIAI